MIVPARKPFAAFTLAALAILAAACSSGREATPSAAAPTAATPGTGTPASANATAISAEDALARYVQRTLSQGFVPSCAKQKRPDDVGKQCATLLGKRGDLVAYALGPTFSDATRILLLKPQSGDWTLVSITTLDPNQPPPPGIPWPLEVGASVVVTGTAPDCLKIRSAPGMAADQLDCVPDGTKANIVAGSVNQDNIDWWQLQDLGWAAGDYLRYSDTATPEPTPKG